MELPQQVRSQVQLGNEGSPNRRWVSGGYLLNCPPQDRRPRNGAGFTLLEMMMALAAFILLVSAVFTLMSGVIQSTATLQNNQNLHDQTSALNAFMKKKLEQMPANSTIVSYQRGEGEGLLQNGIIFGNLNFATAIDAKAQPNGYYTLRIATFETSAAPDQPPDARQVLLLAATTDDPTMTWTPLMTDIKMLDWKFLDFNATQWVDLWSSTSPPNLVEFSLQPSGDLQQSTMDFWLPKIDTISLNTSSASGGTGGGGGGGGGGPGGRGGGGVPGGGGGRGGGPPP